MPAAKLWVQANEGRLTQEGLSNLQTFSPWLSPHLSSPRSSLPPAQQPAPSYLAVLVASSLPSWASILNPSQRQTEWEQQREQQNMKLEIHPCSMAAGGAEKILKITS